MGFPGRRAVTPPVSSHAQPTNHQHPTSLHVRFSICSSDAGNTLSGQVQGLRVEVGGGVSLAGGPMDEVEEIPHGISGARAEVLPPLYHRYRSSTHQRIIYSSVLLVAPTFSHAAQYLKDEEPFLF